MDNDAMTLSLFPEAEPRAMFSRCDDHEVCEDVCRSRRFRYQLEWPLAPGSRTLLFVLANPSTATHLKPDPTVSRCIDYARRWKFSTLLVGNVRAWRETHPELMPEDPQAIGVDNDEHLLEMIERADLIVCGWGELGGARGLEVLRMVRFADKVPHALKLNDSGAPTHPLYLAAALKPFPMPEAGDAR